MTPVPLLVFILGLPLVLGEQFCRCTPPSPCWAGIPWQALNASVGGRLEASVDPLAVCTTDTNGAACASALASSDDEFWLSNQPNGFLHTGLFHVWNLTTLASAFSVLAESEADVQATVAFAHAHSLRLVVKNTGHDWYSRSTARGSLLLWTHRLNTMEWGTSPGDGLPTVTLGPGVQFQALYPAALSRGLVVIGGTCDSVGVGGCWLGGCYGTFSRRLGSGAANILGLRMVLANGTVVALSSTLPHADLFKAMKGGGLGLAGVVTQFTARAHPAPTHLYAYGITLTSRGGNTSAYGELLGGFLTHLDPLLQNPTWGNGGWGMSYSSAAGGTGSISVSGHGWEASYQDLLALLPPIQAWMASVDPAGTTFSLSAPPGTTWNTSQWKGPGDPVPWMEVHPDREISTALLASFTRYIPTSVPGLTPLGATAAAGAAIAAAVAALPPGASGTVYTMYDKTQGGLGEDALAAFHASSLNPALLTTSGLLLVMYNVPSLPTLPPSTPVWKALWPRLQKYVVLSPEDPLWSTCAAGAVDGGDAAARACWEAFVGERAPVLQAALGRVKDILYQAFPNTPSGGGGGVGLGPSGSYIAETDYTDSDWGVSQWGQELYAQLLQVKATYDPEGLFYCHHCVGAEAWSEDGNCRV